MPRRLPGTPAARSSDLYHLVALAHEVDWKNAERKQVIDRVCERVLVLADRMDAEEMRLHDERVAVFLEEHGA